MHEVVGRDASGDGDWHEDFPCLVVVSWSERQSSTLVGGDRHGPRGDTRRHYRLVTVCDPGRSTYVRTVTTPDAESIAELIADCADIPAPHAGEPVLPGQRAATPWEVDEVAFAQVRGMEEYV
jgi:hypothetical protein